MLRIRLYGRDRGDVQLGCDVLGALLRQAGLAACVEGGGPVDGHRVDAAVVLDPDLVADVAAASLTHDAVVYVNAPAEPCGRALHAGRVLAADAAATAHRHGLGSRVATAMGGIFAGASGVLANGVIAAVAASHQGASDAHVAALVEGYGLGEAALENGRPP